MSSRDPVVSGTTWECRYDGTTVPDGHRFCSFCGRTRGTAEVPPQALATPCPKFGQHNDVWTSTLKANEYGARSTGNERRAQKSVWPARTATSVRRGIHLNFQSGCDLQRRTKRPSTNFKTVIQLKSCWTSLVQRSIRSEAQGSPTISRSKHASVFNNSTVIPHV